ncbi:hypothetical protein ACSS6W_005121 [Trichoderma asperelloides]
MVFMFGCRMNIQDPTLDFGGNIRKKSITFKPVAAEKSMRSMSIKWNLYQQELRFLIFKSLNRCKTAYIHIIHIPRM